MGTGYGRRIKKTGTGKVPRRHGQSKSTRLYEERVYGSKTVVDKKPAKLFLKLDDRAGWMPDHVKSFERDMPDEQLVALVKRGNVKGAVEHYKSENEGVQSVSLYENIAFALWKVGPSPSASAHILRLMSAAGLKPNEHIMLYIILSFVKHNRVDEAVRIIKMFKDLEIKASSRVFRAVMEPFVKQGDVEGIRSTLKVLQWNGYHPRVKTFASLMDGLILHKHPIAAVKLYRDIEKRKIKPNSYVLNAVLMAFSSLHDVEGAYMALEEFSAGKVKADAFTLSILFHGIEISPLDAVESHKWTTRVMKQLLPKLRRLEPDVFSMNASMSLTNMYIEKDDKPRAEAAASLMRSRPTTEWNVVMFNILMKCAARFGTFEQAQELLHEMKELDMKRRGTTYFWYFTSMLEEQGVEATATAINEVHESSDCDFSHDIPSFLFGAILRKASFAGDVNGAKVTFDVMSRIGVEISPHHILGLVMSQANIGDWKAASETLYNVLNDSKGEIDITSHTLEKIMLRMPSPEAAFVFKTIILPREIPLENTLVEVLINKFSAQLDVTALLNLFLYVVESKCDVKLQSSAFSALLLSSIEKHDPSTLVAILSQTLARCPMDTISQLENTCQADLKMATSHLCEHKIETSHLTIPEALQHFNAGVPSEL